jgi:hypothetical protein
VWVWVRVGVTVMVTVSRYGWRSRGAGSVGGGWPAERVVAELPVVAPPPTLDAAAGEDRAGVPVAGRDGDDAGAEVDGAQAGHLARRVALAVRAVVAELPRVAQPPALDAAAGEDRAGVQAAGRMRVGAVAARRHAATGCEQHCEGHVSMYAESAHTSRVGVGACCGQALGLCFGTLNEKGARSRGAAYRCIQAQTAKQGFGASGRCVRDERNGLFVSQYITRTAWPFVYRLPGIGCLE